MARHEAKKHSKDNNPVQLKHGLPGRLSQNDKCSHCEAPERPPQVRRLIRARVLEASERRLTEQLQGPLADIHSVSEHQPSERGACAREQIIHCCCDNPNHHSMMKLQGAE